MILMIFFDVCFKVFVSTYILICLFHPIPHPHCNLHLLDKNKINLISPNINITFREHLVYIACVEQGYQKKLMLRGFDENKNLGTYFNFDIFDIILKQCDYFLCSSSSRDFCPSKYR